jgi:hypothetical protein
MKSYRYERKDTVESTVVRYDALRHVFARTSLLEAGLSPGALDHPLGIEDPETFNKQMSGRKAEKFARAWAPLIVHQALTDPRFPRRIEPHAALAHCDSLLAKASHNPWFTLMNEASSKNISAIHAAKTLDKLTQQRLQKHRKEWQMIGQSLESYLAGWIKSHDELIGEYLTGCESSAAVNLKKLARFKPKAA